MRSSNRFPRIVLFVLCSFTVSSSAGIVSRFIARQPFDQAVYEDIPIEGLIQQFKEMQIRKEWGKLKPEELEEYDVIRRTLKNRRDYGAILDRVLIQKACIEQLIK